MGVGSQFLVAGLLVFASAGVALAGSPQVAMAARGGDPGYDNSLKTARSGRPVFSPGSAASEHPELPPRLARLLRGKMIFFVATGGKNACGPGCDEWIAAEGVFDQEAPARFINFLQALGEKKLPIFFHSQGGNLASAMSIGSVLRKRRMMAGIGQTIPRGCRTRPKADDACRRIMQSERTLPSRLRFERALCASSCAYALLGATDRRVAENAVLGIHATTSVRNGKEYKAGSEITDKTKLYVMQMGVAPGLVDLANSVSPRRLHALTKAEMRRFGILVDSVFETRWQVASDENRSPHILKSVTHVDAASRELHTTLFKLRCYPDSASFSVRREIPGEMAPEMIVTSGTDVLIEALRGYLRSPDRVNVTAGAIKTEVIHQASLRPWLSVSERMSDGQRETKVSTAGLKEALKVTSGACGEGVNVSVRKASSSH